MGIEAARLSVVVDADTSKAEAGLHRMGGVVSGAGSKLATFAAAGVGAASAMGIGLARAGMSLEDALMPIGTLVGRNTVEFDELSKAVIGFAKNSPLSPAEIGLGAYEALSSGVEGTKNVMDALSASQQLAQAGLGTLGGSMDIITSAMNAFATEGLTAQQAAETFFGAIDKGKATTESLSQGFGAIAPLAATAGVSFNDLMAATAALTSTGLPAAEAYTGLRSALTNIIKPSDQAAKMAKKLGLDFSVAHLQNVGLPRFLDEVAAATGGNSEVMAQLFGDVQGLNSVLALTGTSAEAFKENLTGLAESGAGLSDRAAEVSDTWSNRWREAKNRFSIWAGEIGLKIADWLQPRIASFIGWWKSEWPTISRVGGEVIDTLVGYAKWWWDLWGPMLTAVAKGVVSWFERNWPRIAAVVHAVSDGVGKAVAWWREHWPAMLATARDGITRVRDAVVPVVRKVVGYIVGYAQDLIAWWRRNWPAISEAVTHVMNVVRGVIERVLGFVQALWRNYGDRIVGYVRGIFNIIRGIVQTVMSYIRGVIETVMHLINGDWGKAWDAFRRMVSGVWDGVVRIVTGAVEMVVNVVMGLGRAISAGARAAWPAIKDGLGAAVDSVVGFFTGLPGRVLTAIGLLPGILGNVARMAVKGLFNAAGLAWGEGVKFFEELPGKILGALGNAGAVLWDWGHGLAKGLWNGFKAAWNWMADKLTFTLPKIHIPGTSIDIGGYPISLIPHLAGGGAITRAGLALVGERGAEVVSLPRGSAVYPTGTMPAGGGGAGIVIHNLVIQATTETEARAAAHTVMTEFARFERLNGPRYARSN